MCALECLLGRVVQIPFYGDGKGRNSKGDISF